MTPKPVWNPDLPVTEPFRQQWLDVPDNDDLDNGFKVQWEQFLRHVVADAPHPYDFRAGARGIALAEAGLRSSAEGRRIELAEIPRCDAAACGATPRRPTVTFRDHRATRARGRGRAPDCAHRRPHRLTRQRMSWPRCGGDNTPGRPGRRRLGRHPRLPPPPVVLRAGRRRGDGHRAARHGAGLGRHPGAHPAQRRRGRAVRRAASPPAPAPTTSRPAATVGRGGRRLRASARIRRRHRRAARS